MCKLDTTEMWMMFVSYRYSRGNTNWSLREGRETSTRMTQYSRYWRKQAQAMNSDINTWASVVGIRSVHKGMRSSHGIYRWGSLRTIWSQSFVVHASASIMKGWVARAALNSPAISINISLSFSSASGKKCHQNDFLKVLFSVKQISYDMIQTSKSWWRSRVAIMSVRSSLVPVTRRTMMRTSGVPSLKFASPVL